MDGMRQHLAHLVVLLLVSGAWSESASAQLTEADLLGCYDVNAAGEWQLVESSLGSPYLERASEVLAGDSVFYEVPPRIRLAAPLADAGSAWEIVVPEGALPTRHRFMSYGVRNDTLALWFSTGYAGVIADLGGTGETGWTGLARTWDDYTGLQWSRRIDLAPVSCDSPPPVPSSVMRSVPRAVQLVGGATIQLGEPLPESLKTSPRRLGSLTVIGRTEGLFGTTDSIAVAVNDARGRIGRIQLIYLDPDLSSVVEARLTDAFGPPTSGGGSGSTGIEWRNRVTRVWLSKGARFTVNLRDYRYFQ